MKAPRREEPELTYAIGDIHGQCGKLVRLLNICREHSAGRSFQVVCVGDYVDRGPQSKEVVELLMAAQASYGNRLICLRGNHEQLLTSAAQPSASGSAIRHWLVNGGAATLKSYDVDHPSSIPDSHIEWLASRPITFKSQGRFYVHAGIMPGIPLQLQTEEDLLWIREPFLSSQERHELFVVHGHTPTETRKPDLRANRLNIDTGAGWGGPLTAAVFTAGRVAPVCFLTDSGDVNQSDFS